MLYLLNHEIFISVLGIQDGIFLYFLFFTSAKRNFQLKGVKQLIFAQIGSQQCREILAEWLSLGEGRLGLFLFGGLSPVLHPTSKHASTTAQVTCSSEFGRAHQIVKTFTPSHLLLGVTESEQRGLAGTSPGAGLPLTVLVMLLAMLGHASMNFGRPFKRQVYSAERRAESRG